MSRVDYTALIHRVQSAGYLSDWPELNQDIAIACGWSYDGAWFPPADAEDQAGQDDPPDYHCAFDAAFSVLPKGAILHKLERNPDGTIQVLTSRSGELFQVSGPDVYTALVVSGLRMRQARQKAEDAGAASW